MTREQFADFLKNMSGTKIITLYTRTVPKLNKQGRALFKDILKESVVNGMVNASYENRVNKVLSQNGQEPNFQEQERAWGERTNGLVEHNGKTYISIIPNRTKSRYIADGKEISYEEIKDYLPKHKGDVVDYRNYDLNNVLDVVCGDLTLEHV